MLLKFLFGLIFFVGVIRAHSDPEIWEDGVQKVYTMCSSAFKNCAGPSKDIGEFVVESYKVYTEQLIKLTESGSQVLSSNSARILQAISLFSPNLNESSINNLYEFRKNMAPATRIFGRIVTDLGNIFGKLTDPINEVVTDIELAFVALIKQFEKWYAQPEKIKRLRCSEIKLEGLMKSARRLINTISKISETAMNYDQREKSSNDIKEAISVVVLILNFITLGVEGVISTIDSELYRVTGSIPKFHRSCALSLYPFITHLTETVTSMTNNIAESVRRLLLVVVQLTQSLNLVLNSLIGVFQGVSDTIVQTTKSLCNALPLKLF